MTQWEWDHTKLSGSKFQLSLSQPSSRLVQVAIRAQFSVLPPLPPGHPWTRVTVTLATRCCEPWSRILDNKAKVINWLWLDSNNTGLPWHLTHGHVTGLISQPSSDILILTLIVWHDPTFTWRLHQPPMRFMIRNRAFEPTHNYPAPEQFPTFSNRHVETYAVVFVFRKCCHVFNIVPDSRSVYICSWRSLRRQKQRSCELMKYYFCVLWTFSSFLHFKQKEYVYLAENLFLFCFLSCHHQTSSSFISVHFQIDQINCLNIFKH